MTNTQTTKYIYVFSEQGSNYLPVYFRLQESFKDKNVIIKRVSKADLIDTTTFTAENVLAFFLPGAAQNGEYDVRLGNDGFDAIRSYVQEGGHFVGICAGAYYASAKLEWSHDHEENKSTKTPSLRFFNGLARGPISQITPHEDWHVMRAIQVKSDDPDLGVFKAIYWGGPEFICPDNYQSVEVMVSFDEQGLKSPCIIKRREGLGTVTLSSIHPELSPSILKKLMPANHSVSDNVKQMIQETKTYERQRLHLWQTILKPIHEHHQRLDQKRLFRKTGLLFSRKKGIE